MFLATASTKRPIAMASLLIALVFLGANSYRKLSLENLPSVDIPYVTVTTTWAGASSEDMEKDVAKYIEDAVSGVEGLKHVTSTCIENVANCVIEFNLDVNVDVAAQDVREKIDAIISDLPSGCDRPVIKKLDLNATSICTLFLSGDMNVDDLYWLADNEISDQFASVKGVAEVQIIGGEEREVWISLDRDAVAAAGLTAADVVQAVQKEVLSVPGGRIRQEGSEYAVKFDAEYKTVDEIKELPVANKNGIRRTIGDLGRVHLATEEVRQRSFLNGNPGITIKIVKKSDGNTVETVKAIQTRFENIRKNLPPGVRLDWLQDDAAIVQANVDNTINDIVSSVILCAFILFAFLVNLRTTFIVAVTMPITIIISFFFMQLAGLTLNITTLLAIGLSAGILVSNSIVVLENIARRFEDTPDRWEAARIGTDEVTVAVLASAGTNIVVMLPIAMMTSIVGRYFAPFALTTLIVNIASIFISFTLTPMLCALWMRPMSQQTGSLSRIGRSWEAFLSKTGNAYGSWLQKVSDNRLLSLGAVVASVLLFFFSISFCTKGLGFNMMENDDWGRIFVRLEYPDYYDLARTTEETRKIADDMQTLPGIETVLLTVGRADAISGQASEGVYLAQLELVFVEPARRDWKISSMLDQVRTRLSDVPDLIFAATIPGYVSGSNASISTAMVGDDLDVITENAQKLQQLVFSLPGIAQFDTTARDDKPEIRILPNRAILSDLGISASAVGTIVRANIDGIEAASFKEDRKTIDIRVKLDEREGTGQVAAFPIPSRPGRPIPLEAFTTEQPTGQKVMIFRHDKRRAITMLGNEVDGYATGTLLNEIHRLAEENNLVDDNIQLKNLGSSEMLDETVSDFMEAILLASLLTYLTLSAILESFSRPFLVLLTFPMSLIGVFWALKATGMNVSIFVLLGIVMLIGVVVNAAVLIVDKMDQLLRAGTERPLAMCKAVSQTFRAVLMVVIASGLGMLPIALSTGIGAVNRIGIGAASVGGIIVAGVLTLTVLPLLQNLFIKRARTPGLRP